MNLSACDRKPVNLQDDDFTLFGLTQKFAQDRAAVDARWKDLQRGAHPDKFAAQGAAAQRIAMQWSVRINEAYQRLKDPLKRAAYLCELAGHAVNAHSNTAMPSAFLIQQMEWREALEDASKLENLEKIAAQAAQGKREQLQKCEHFLDVACDYPAAVAAVRTLMFIDKLQQELDQRLDEME